MSKEDSLTIEQAIRLISSIDCSHHEHGNELPLCKKCLPAIFASVRAEDPPRKGRTQLAACDTNLMKINP